MSSKDSPMNRDQKNPKSSSLTRNVRKSLMLSGYALIPATIYVFSYLAVKLEPVTASQLTMLDAKRFTLAYLGLIPLFAFLNSKRISIGDFFYRGASFLILTAGFLIMMNVDQSCAQVKSVKEYAISDHIDAWLIELFGCYAPHYKNKLFVYLGLASVFYTIDKISDSRLVNLFIYITLVFTPDIYWLIYLNRVDSLYFLFFSLFFAVLLNFVKSRSIESFYLLIGLSVTSAFVRESFAYISMPILSVLLILTQDKKKIGYVILCLGLSLFSYRVWLYSEYGISSKYKNFHLVVKAMQYGYFSPQRMLEYKKSLGDDTFNLATEINKDFLNEIVPSKRSNASDSYIYPYSEHIRYRNSRLPGHIVNEANNLISKLLITAPDKRNDLLKNIEESSQNNLEALELVKFILAKKTKIITDSYPCWNKLTPCENNITANLKPEISALSDNWNYSEIGLRYGYNETKEQIKYHKNIDNISEIILSRPLLYLAQSLILTQSFGRSERGNNCFSDIRTKAPLIDVVENLCIGNSKFISIFTQFWLPLSLIGIAASIFIFKDYYIRVSLVIVSMISLIQPVFLSFATYGEFQRLLITTLPISVAFFFVLINMTFLKVFNAFRHL